MHEKTARRRSKSVTPGPAVPGQAALVAQRGREQYRRLEVMELFGQAERLCPDPLEGHLLAEASLDYLTDEHFDDTDDEKARVEQAEADVANARSGQS